MNPDVIVLALIAGLVLIPIILVIIISAIKSSSSEGELTEDLMQQAASDARQWWSDQPGRTQANCDRCSQVIPRNQGYLTAPKWAFVNVEGPGRSEMLNTLDRAGLSNTPDLVCRTCLESHAGEPWAIPYSKWKSQG